MILAVQVIKNIKKPICTALYSVYLCTYNIDIWTYTSY